MHQRFTYQVENRSWDIDMGSPIELAIPLDFSGEQPRAFGLPQASSRPFQAGEFVGALEKGGPVNCFTLEITPHGNGTHTETSLHIDPDGPRLDQISLSPWMLCLVLTVPLQSKDETDDSYAVKLTELDRFVTSQALEEAFQDKQDLPYDALVLRTLPNPVEKLSRDYSGSFAPFLSREAMHWVRGHSFSHLLVDCPSVDREDDEGKLENHRTFWESNKLGTITEMVYLPEVHEDGVYMLNLQVPRFCMDAAPSRPVLYPLLSTDES